MTESGLWIIGLALLYTAVLIGAGQYAKRRAGGDDNYFVGGRRFNKWMVAACITGLFSGSSYIAILELSYLTGISAIWYGVAETVQVLIIVLVLIGPFRERLVVTISGLIGDKYGRLARGIAGAITAFAFPMWSVATALAFASALYVFTGLPLTVSVIFTAVLLLIFLQAGGMWSIGFTQVANCIACLAMFAVGTLAFFINPGWAGVVEMVQREPRFTDLFSVGTQVIVVWMGTFVLNVILAQAAFQMALSCRTPDEGRKGLYIAMIFDIPFMFLGVLFGVAAAVVTPGHARGLVAVPMYIAEVLPPPLVGVFFLGIWACALGWGAPCQFSGATSLGRDVGLAINPRATGEQLVTYTRWSLLLLTGLMILFGFLRSEQSAWWNILAWTTRNSATFAPVLGALFWPLASRRAVLVSMVVGCASGLLWYHLGGWAVASFYLDVHPVWVGMGSNLLVLGLVSLWDFQGSAWTWARSGSTHRIAGALSLAAGVAAVAAGLIWFAPLHQSGLVGLVFFVGVTGLTAGQFLLVRPPYEDGSVHAVVAAD